MTLEQLELELQGLKGDLAHARAEIAQLRGEVQPVIDQHKLPPPQVLEQIQRMTAGILANDPGMHPQLRP